MTLAHHRTRDVRTWPAYTRTRRRIARLQDVTGRAATLAGLALGGTGMLLPDVALPGLAAAALTTGAGLATLRAWRPAGVTKAAATAMYALPGAGLCALLGWEALVGGPHWGMALGLLTWVTGTWAIRPAWAARRMLADPPPQPELAPPEPAAELEPPATHSAARWWAEHVATEDGPAPGTVLRKVEPYGTGVRAIVAADRPGTAVPDISKAALSALLDVPEELIHVGPVPGRGTGVRMITIGKAEDETTTAQALWARDIAPKAMPRTTLTEIRHGTGDRAGIVELHVEAPRGHEITYNPRTLASALDCEDDPSRVIVEATVRRAIVTVYPSNPLAQVRAVRREDLIMDERGYYTAGVHHNGRPARRRLFDTETGSAQRFLLFGTTGAGKSRALQIQLAAEKINGIVTWLADLKEGQSVPEAAGNVDWRVTTPEGAIMMLRAAVAVAHARMRRAAAEGRNSFLLGGPDRLLHVHIDEANRLLEEGAPYRDEAVLLIRELARTGRSVGVGVGLAAQASHLEELGGSDTMRGLLKEGEVTLLRWSSSMMRQLVADGLLPSGMQLTPIPKRISGTRLVSQFDEDADDDDTGIGTQGMAYLLSSPRPTSLMRHFRIGSITPLPGLDPEIMELYGSEPPVELGPEDAAAAGEAYQVRHFEDALVVLLAESVAAKITRPPGTQQPATAPQTAPPAQPAQQPQTSQAPAVAPPRHLNDRVLDALRAAGRSLTAAEVLEIVNADGGRTVALGSIRNALSQLANQGQAVRTEHGHYTIPLEGDSQ